MAQTGPLGFWLRKLFYWVWPLSVPERSIYYYEAAKRIADIHEKKGKGYVDLPIHLSKLNINSSKELINNVKQQVKSLSNNKQITKKVYNILNKITYKNDS